MSFWILITFIKSDIILIDRKYHSVNTLSTRVNQWNQNGVFSFSSYLTHSSGFKIEWWFEPHVPSYLFISSLAFLLYRGSKKISFVKILFYLWYAILNSLLFIFGFFFVLFFFAQPNWIYEWKENPVAFSFFFFFIL